MVKRAYFALWALFLAVVGALTIPSCTAILGIDTTYSKNACNEDAGPLEPLDCGRGACHQLLPACDDNGLPASCPEPKPAAAEVCSDGIDNNCDGNIEEGCTCDVTMVPSQSCFSGSTANRNVGACKLGEQLCTGGVWALCQGDVLPVPEICDDGIDNNCDGKVDEGCPCTEGQEQPCYGGPPDTKGQSPCQEGKQVCSEGAWGACVGDILPTQEVCDGVDNDCNGMKDDAAACDCPDGKDKDCYDGPDNTVTHLPCHAGKRKCVNGTLGACQNQVVPDVETCDGVDNDCDGTPDNGNLSTNADCTVPGAQGECAAGTAKCTGGQQLCVPKSTSQPDNTCDGKDQDCNGTPDDGAIPNVGPQFPCTVAGALGECSKGNFACQNGMIICASTTTKALETCDGLDNDCNGMVDEGNPGAGKACPTGKSGKCDTGTTACVGGAIACNQNFQPSPEACDNADNDCDGIVDNGNPGGGSNCLSGLSGVCSAGTTTCVNGALKCNQTNPSSPESCDGVDNDCDGAVDNGNPQGGGPCTVASATGLCAAGVQICTGGKLTCTQSVVPAPEQCDGKDNDCDGVVDNGNPGAGSVCTTGVPGVCSKGVTSCFNGGLSCNQTLQPTLEVCDGLDNNCNGTVDEGNPGGGSPCTLPGAKGVCAAGTVACQNSALSCTQTVSPTPELCNGQDDDCNGTVDENNPGGGGTCTVPGLQGLCASGVVACQSGLLACTQVAFSTPEVCNNKDDNCNGQIDEGSPGGGLACNTSLSGVCAAGTTACAGGITVCNQNVQAGLELCDGKDNDCDGIIDNGNPGGGVACTVAGKFGVCAAGTKACTGGALVCNQTVQAINEICNGLDDNCNGQADEGNPQGGGPCTTGQQGVCSPGIFNCTNGALSCAQNVQASTELCDGLDNNCNGAVDEGNPGGGANCTTSKFGICAAGTTVCTGSMITCQQTLVPVTEICDGKDNDCDGVIDNGNPGAGQACTTNKPGLCAAGSTACTAGAIVCNQTLQPVTEVCDGLDNNCNGSIDEGNPGGNLSCTTGQPGACAAGTSLCSGGTLSCQPNASATAEICDGLDNNCDGVVDNGNPGGGVACNTGKLGVCGAGTTTCTGGAVVCVQNVQPSAEICDGKDNDCTGAVDDGNPGGGAACNSGKFGICAAGTSACNAGVIVCNQNAQPATETCNGLDDNCDNIIDNGNPGGGGACSTGQPGACAAGTTTCSSGNLTCAPTTSATAEVCDGVDNNCDGVIDNGNPGGGVACTTGKSGVCSPGITACTAGAVACNQNVLPSTETCNGLDDNCNGTIDEGNPGGGTACSTGKSGVCAAGTQTCTAGALVCNQSVPSSTEVCEGTLDENCNGAVDEGCNCVNGATPSCYTGAAGTQGVGLCHAGTKTCVSGNFGACTGQVVPSTETCDGLDSDCDGVVDNGNPGGGVVCATGNSGVCSPGITACTAGAVACNQNVLPSTETCNGLDDNCDGTIDEGNPGGGAACSTGKSGVCAAGTQTCTAGALVCSQNVPSSTEVCEGALDESCNGAVDEGCNCVNGATPSCYTGAAGTQGVGLCHAGIKTCVSGNFGACTGEVVPSTETCDGLDSDCDGVVDNGNPGGGVVCATGNSGVCSPGITACTAGAVACNQNVLPSAETCNGLDDNCDGTIDEGNPGGGAACTVLGKLGICAASTLTCTGGALVCNQTVLPAAEVCGDGIDQDCDGKTGAYLPLVLGGTASWDMSSSTGWTISGAGSVWDFPAAAASGCGDPTVDTTSTADNMIAGVNVGGCVANTSVSNLTTPAITTTIGVTVHLQYQRWLRDSAAVTSNLFFAAPPTPPPASPTSYLFCSGNKPASGCPSGSPATTFDSNWVSHTVAITPSTSSIQITWRAVGAANQSVGGWNIDDVAVVDDPCQ